jgi:hypothetical protein
MEFGSRTIRSAGQGSGSVEVTLPVAFRGLAGVACRLALRDGLRPEIVLQPDLRTARRALAQLWDLLRHAMDCAAPAHPPLAEALVTLWPAEHAADGVPRLAWHDGLVLASPPPQDAAAAGRCIAAFAQLLAPPLGIGPTLAAAFGTAAACALTGHVAPGAEADAEIAAAVLMREGMRPGAPLALAGDALSPGFAAAARPALLLLRDTCLDWTADPPRHAALRAAWRRGIALEFEGS